MDNLISAREAADILMCDVQMVYYFIRTGRLASRKIGHAVLLDRANVERLGAARRMLKQGVANAAPAAAEVV